jgi:hypothetical protein
MLWGRDSTNNAPIRQNRVMMLRDLARRSSKKDNTHKSIHAIINLFHPTQAAFSTSGFAALFFYTSALLFDIPVLD